MKMHDYAMRKKQSNKEKKWRSQKKAAEPNIHIGDYVLAAVIDRKSKLHLSWDGPFQVVGTKNRHVYVLQRPNTKDKKEAHGRRLKRYCGAQDGEHAELVSAAVSKKGSGKPSEFSRGDTKRTPPQSTLRSSGPGSRAIGPRSRGSKTSSKTRTHALWCATF